MMSRWVPDSLSRILWGDRKKYGLAPDKSDKDWDEWQQKAYSDFYPNTQQKGIGALVSGMAYPIISRVDFSAKKVLEIGPGKIRHLEFMNQKPEVYVLCDVRRSLLKTAGAQLHAAGINFETVLTEKDDHCLRLPFDNDSFDIIITFNSLEHLHPLNDYLSEMKRILVNGGKILGGIPCEGGLAWGLGRFFTTRRFVHKNYGINYDKIICWEHPNSADVILEKLDVYFKKEFLKLHPFSWLPMDMNLMASFIYKNEMSHQLISCGFRTHQRDDKRLICESAESK